VAAIDDAWRWIAQRVQAHGSASRSEWRHMAGRGKALRKIFFGE
jgi:hypothetical protein